MLLSKGYSAGDIVSFKLVNGDEIVAKIAEVTGTGWKISRPCTVIPSAQGMALMQSLFSTELNTDIELRADHVMMHSESAKQVQDYYLTTTTGIQTVSKGSIVA
jgi:hypothetical protein